MWKIFAKWQSVIMDGVHATVSAHAVRTKYLPTCESPTIVPLGELARGIGACISVGSAAVGDSGHDGSGANYCGSGNAASGFSGQSATGQGAAGYGGIGNSASGGGL